MILAASNSLAHAGDATVDMLVAKLADVDSDVRADAAAELRRMLAGDFGARTNNHGRLYWEERLSRVKPGMKHEEVLKILPPVDNDIAGMGSGQTHFLQWRLDDYWTVTVHYHNPDIVHEARATLGRRVRDVWINPPADDTGKWTTWHVNGEKSREIEYWKGKTSGAYTCFHDNGRKSYEQHYVSGICSGTDCGWYADGSKTYEGQYVDGEREGTWTHWYRNGRLQSREILRGGKRNGVCTSWRENGQKQDESSYREDEKHGPDKAWNRDGSLLWSREYRDGKLVEGE